MIKCNRCGKMSPAGAVCQSCGAPLSNKVDNGFAPKMAGQDQSELPAWLESLRAGERSSAPANSPSSFSTADFIEEGSLPNWMRSERSNGFENTASNPPVSAFTGFQQGPFAGDQNLPSDGIAAHSLIDEQSLPSWMQEGKQQANDISSGPLSAASLVQPDAVPEWMKQLQPPQSQVPQVPQTPVVKAEPFASFEAPKPAANTTNADVSNLSSGFSAHDLIDQQALPSWMKQQQETPENKQGFTGAKPQSSVRPEPQPSTPAFDQQQGFSASSLLDADALPQWMREANLDPSRSSSSFGSGNASAQPPVTPPQSSWPAQSASNASWPPQGPSNTAWPAMQQTPPESPVSPEQSGFSAGSLIDAGSLPQWLRSNGDQAQQQGPGMAPKPGSYAVPHRGENVRVPNRPRGNDVRSGENSEVAANVFASMLGVASSNSGNPAAQANAPYAQPGQPAQPNVNQSGIYNSPVQPNQSYGQPNPSAQGNTYNQSYGQSDQAMPGNTYGQPNSPAQSNTYNQSMQGNAYNQSYGQPDQAMPGNTYNQPYGQSNQPDLYGQNSLSGQQGAYGQPSYGGVSNASGIGPIPNTPNNSANLPGAYSQGGYPPSNASMPGSYGNSYAGNMQGPANASMSGNPSFGGGAPYQGAGSNNMAGSQQSPDMRDGKNAKKRGLFGAFLDWFNR